MDLPYKSSTQLIYPAPVGKERVFALQHLGCTFKEGDHDVTKIATPAITDTQEDLIPTFMDAEMDNNTTSSSSSTESNPMMDHKSG
ncbi:uncharacterized protein BX664DRAFT_356650 [Halteromyces radiatus]|uniref:uncharacterized protein n=1 Tax=Halteromyces radiatus TaxID=101107 RepID=UPI00221FFA43|nr:uncharacterized protein BX664DRAFT_356650 [Halteromyces radiatus]KAI8097400.1 hypothetical protein BX664DRAFT_356650 [Halteromyces radiatus]